jgi:hypothetical protein
LRNSTSRMTASWKRSRKSGRQPRKPDEDMHRKSLDCARVLLEEVVYIDDRAMFVEVAQGFPDIRDCSYRIQLHAEEAERNGT